jgi:hypothetical protein
VGGGARARTVNSNYRSSNAYAAPSFENQLLITTIEWSIAIALAIATAVVVVWQNSHLAVLWDLSYTLDNSYRIALGDVPYRDFPFAHPPLTFLIQAALIKLTGRVYWHHVAYCAVTAAFGTLLTWRIMRLILSAFPFAKTIALVLSLPLIPLGIHSVFPHPFYDPDCTLAILISLLLLSYLDRRPKSFVLPMCAGASLVTPLFIKQNTGLGFLLSAIGLLLALLIWRKLKHEEVRDYVVTIVAAVVALAIALLLIQRFAGLGNYWHWTIQFAAQRRTPARQEMLEIYTDKTNLLWLGLVAAGLLTVRFSRMRNRLWLMFATLLLTAPFAWPALYLLGNADSSERAERLINVWPVLLIVAVISAALTIGRRSGVAKILPFMIIAAIQGCFMSQQLWGSTYGIWPLFSLLFAMTLTNISGLDRLDAALRPQIDGQTSPPSKPSDDLKWVTLSIASATALSLFVAGVFYVRSHERLSYANLDDGELHRASLPGLKGLSTRGNWIPNFEELVHYANGRVGPNEGILLLPGEDPFYYATGRRPQFPVLLFDHTVNPYSPEQIRALCRERNIQWVIVKQELQNEEDAVDEEKERIIAALEEDFEHVDELGNYDIYHRIDPNAPKQSDDDDDDDDEP